MALKWVFVAEQIAEASSLPRRRNRYLPLVDIESVQLKRQSNVPGATFEARIEYSLFIVEPDDHDAEPECYVMSTYRLIYESDYPNTKASRREFIKELVAHSWPSWCTHMNQTLVNMGWPPLWLAHEPPVEMFAKAQDAYRPVRSRTAKAE